MDCKSESAVKTLLRIEVLILQGCLDSVFLCLIGVLLIPFSPLIYAMMRWRVGRKRLHWLTRVVCLPLWMLTGALIGLVNPFVVFLKSISDIGTVVKVEWATRWMTGKPKKPDGHPLVVRSAEDKERLESAILMGVVRDYNDEAREYGQGIDIDEDEGE